MTQETTSNVGRLLRPTVGVSSLPLFESPNMRILVVPNLGSCTLVYHKPKGERTLGTKIFGIHDRSLDPRRSSCGHGPKLERR